MATIAPVVAEVPIKSIRVPHLNGTSIGHQIPKPIIGSKATLVLIPPFGVGAAVFRPQVIDPVLTAAVNLLVLEPIGQGISKTNAAAHSAWDSAAAFLQVLDALNVKKAFVCGESAGGWIAARMALYAPDRIQGLIPIVSDMDNTGPSTIDAQLLGKMAEINPILSLLLSPEGSEWTPPQPNETSLAAALGPSPSADGKQTFITAMTQSNSYKAAGDRERLWQAVLASMTRDSLLSRLGDIKCPVLWIAGGSDPFAIKEGVTKQIGMIKGVVQYEVIPDAYHLPTYTHPMVVGGLFIDFIKKHGGMKDARAMREAVGMVDI